MSDETKLLADVGDQIIEAENEMAGAIAEGDSNRQAFIQGKLDTLKGFEESFRYQIAKKYN